jgi:acyl-CoA thioester hydrolase
MSEFKFFHPIQLRYSDLDTQWHVNNVRFVEFMEAARFAYIAAIGIWKSSDFRDLGLIVANVQVSYLKPIPPGAQIRVGVRTSRLGNKSLDIEYMIENIGDAHTAATGSTAMVSYDYHTGATIPIPAEWRKIISAYEGIPPFPADHPSK